LLRWNNSQPGADTGSGHLQG